MKISYIILLFKKKKKCVDFKYIECINQINSFIINAIRI